jgi:hypothetical protein
MARWSEPSDFVCWTHTSHRQTRQNEWQGNKDSNLGMLESKSSALTSLAIPLRNLHYLSLHLAYFSVKYYDRQNFIL